MGRKTRKTTTTATPAVLETPAVLDTPAVLPAPEPQPEPETIETDNGLDALVALADDGGAGAFEPTSRSIVRAKYRREYAKTHRSCWDDVAKEMRAYLFDDEDGELLNHAKMRRFAMANGCWQDSYSRLNPGQQRMNIGNRLRAKMRKDAEFVVAWVD